LRQDVAACSVGRPLQQNAVTDCRELSDTIGQYPTLLVSSAFERGGTVSAQGRPQQNWNQCRVLGQEDDDDDNDDRWSRFHRAVGCHERNGNSIIVAELGILRARILSRPARSSGSHTEKSQGTWRGKIVIVTAGRTKAATSFPSSFAPNLISYC
jgi:hypothetical protein